jgi:signal transduction histidine kinase
MTRPSAAHTFPEDRPARVPFTTVLASIVGLWLCYFLLSTLRAELLDLGFAWDMMIRRAAASAAGAVITIGLWLVLRLFDDKPLWAKIVAALLLSLPVALSIAQANYLIFLDMRGPIEQRMAEQAGLAPGSVPTTSSGDILVDVPELQPPPETTGAHAGIKSAAEDDGWINLIELTFSRYYLMLAWCALYLALLTGEKARAAERREGEFRRAAKHAELRSLRYQVNPHFLFNTLNSLSALVLTGRTKDAERMIQTLSTFYRHSLTDDPTSDVPLGHEFKLQRLYLDIEAVRFPQRLRAEYELPKALADAAIPGMILQPLVENSVKHAVAASPDPVTITIAAREEYGRLVVTVSDDGRAAASREETRPGYGIGLANVRERLEARFGREASMVSGATPEGYVTLLRMPIERSFNASL